MKHSLSDGRLQTRLDTLSKKVVAPLGKTGVLFLDTGAVIDFEREIHLCHLKDPQSTPSFFYQSLHAVIPSLFVTAPVLSEIRRHHELHRYNGRPEISAETFNLMGLFYSSYCDFVRTNPSSLSPDKARYDTYWASQFAFDPDHKKACSDEISVVDRDLVSSALLTRYSGDVACVAVASSDSHIAKSLAVLNDQIPIREAYVTCLSRKLGLPPEHCLNGEVLSFGYDGLVPVHSRGENHG